MKNLLKIMTLPLLLLSTAMIVAPIEEADVYEEISSAIRSGNAKDVAQHFSSSISLTILTQEDTYSKAQAEVILRDFFSKNPPKSFAVLHKGASREGTLFAIGNYITVTGAVFRTSLFMKQVTGQYYIQELRFEKE